MNNNVLQEIVVARRGLARIKEIKGLGCPTALFPRQRFQRLTVGVSHAHQSMPVIMLIASAASLVLFTPLV